VVILDLWVWDLSRASYQGVASAMPLKISSETALAAGLYTLPQRLKPVCFFCLCGVSEDTPGYEEKLAKLPICDL